MSVKDFILNSHMYTAPNLYISLKRLSPNTCTLFFFLSFYFEIFIFVTDSDSPSPSSPKSVLDIFTFSGMFYFALLVDKSQHTVVASCFSNISQRGFSPFLFPLWASLPNHLSFKQSS